jgi:DNA anti-recombination protein RmuC
MISKIGLGIVVAAIVASGAGCSKKETPPAAPAKGATTAPSPLASDLGKAAGQAAGQASSAAKEQLVSGFAAELEAQQKQAQAITTDAKKYADQQLDSLLKTLDTKLTSVSDKISQIRTADEGSSKALQAEIQKMLGEAGDLYKQAQARLAALVKG